MGFFTDICDEYRENADMMSQSLSGWDGVFHKSGRGPRGAIRGPVAIPFRVGWGFSPATKILLPPCGKLCRNPFQGGMGFFTAGIRSLTRTSGSVAIPFRVGWGFSLRGTPVPGSPYLAYVAIPFRVGWGFSRENSGLHDCSG